jgi:hypothetical protein
MSKMSPRNEKIESIHQEGEMVVMSHLVTVEPVDPPLFNSTIHSEPHYAVYKRRFFGLGQLVLLNIVVSWDVRENISFISTYA